MHTYMWLNYIFYKQPSSTLIKLCKQNCRWLYETVYNPWPLYDPIHAPMPPKGNYANVFRAPGGGVLARQPYGNLI